MFCFWTVTVLRISSSISLLKLEFSRSNLHTIWQICKRYRCWLQKSLQSFYHVTQEGISTLRNTVLRIHNTTNAYNIYMLYKSSPVKVSQNLGLKFSATKSKFRGRQLYVMSFFFLQNLNCVILYACIKIRPKLPTSKTNILKLTMKENLFWINNSWWWCAYEGTISKLQLWKCL